VTKKYSQSIFNYTKAIEINPKYAGAYYDRSTAYYMTKNYDNAWADVHKAKELGYAVDPKFIDELKKVSGRDK